MSDRREFLGRLAGGAAAVASSRVLRAQRVPGANDRIRIGLIGAGGRGMEIFRAALAVPNVEAVAVADVYSRRLEHARSVAPAAKTYSDFRRLLDDRSIDAVLIATPQHQHALNFVPAIEAGKDVYQEKTMAFNADHARRMRKAFEGSKRVVQIGIQSTSGPAQPQAQELARSDRMGTITALHSHMYRNASYGGWLRPLPPDCDPQHVDWPSFQGEARPTAFDAMRVINWRFFWDYSGGNVFENMVHQVGFWYKALGLNIPRAVWMSGGNYLSPKMQVPDTMNVSMDQPENLLFTWSSGFYNNYYDSDEQVLGTRGTVIRGDQDVRFVAQTDTAGQVADEPPEMPSSRQKRGADIVGVADETDLHMRNFFDCVRSRREPNCPFEIGYRSAIACRMAITSYRERRAVRWDAEREEIV